MDIHTKIFNLILMSTSGFVLILEKGVVSWRSLKQSTTTDSTIKEKYIVAWEAAKEIVWMRKFIQELGGVPLYSVTTMEQ